MINSQWFSHVIDDFNSRNRLKPTDLGYKRVYLNLTGPDPKHIKSDYESVTMALPDPIPSYWVFHQESLTHID